MEPAHARPLATSLPADLLRRIFDATAGSGRHRQRYSVLSFEERVRAEVRCGCCLLQQLLSPAGAPAAWSAAKTGGPLTFHSAGALCCRRLATRPALPRKFTAVKPTSCLASFLPQTVNKHWRATLTAEPGSYISLKVSPPTGLGLGGWMQERRTDGLGKAAARARALAARAPAVDAVSLDINVPSNDSHDSVELMAAYAATLQALLDRPVSISAEHRR